MTKIFSLFLIATLIGTTLAFPIVGRAQQTKQQEKIEKIRAKIIKLESGEQTRVKVKLNNDTTYQGYVKQANDDDFVVVDKAGNATTISYSDVHSIGGKNLSTGAKIAIGIGIGAGATIFIILAIIAHLD